MIDNESILFQHLLAIHEPKLKPFEEAASPGWQLTQCSACDGSNWRIVRPGEQVPECELRQRARALGLVS